MTTPLPARDHANMTAAEREFTFDALLAEFDDNATQAEGGAASDSAAARPAKRPIERAAKRPVERGARRAAGARPKARVSDAAGTNSASKKRRARRSWVTPSADDLKLGGLVVVAGISLTLVVVALSR
ncbi:hypothetical protein [Agreia sp. VKM Ac-1783]|uniref:hypothetical protein n=1 Tax=Agreia sp. VKM Ac-1783 TaxID=1938889 RepID=UPI000A2AC7F4|nr:hypothetical protein [Agreia sp. VKM Ac-1783]SMQ58265.1 hypothetical protein SAMN06295943_0142 [Agreia sp. VKM Ac-1783]